jgi:hypothetical protein
VQRATDAAVPAGLPDRVQQLRIEQDAGGGARVDVGVDHGDGEDDRLPAGTLLQRPAPVANGPA